MNQPSLDELLQKVDSRYTLVVVAAKRARALTSNGTKNGADKPVTTALKEIVDNKIKYKQYKKKIK